MSNLTGKTFVVGLGAQKAGTTWLAQYLRAHSQCFIPLLKELHFFRPYRKDLSFSPAEARFVGKLKAHVADHPPMSADEGATPRRKYYDRLETMVDRLRMGDSLELYRALFEKRVQPEHRVFGEVTPSYCLLSEEALQKIRDTHDRVRAVLLLRDPADRTWSQLWFRHNKNPGFDPNEQWRTALTDKAITSRCDYREILTRLESVFSPKELYVGFFEHLFTQESVEAICEFLGIDVEPADFERNPNPTGQSGKVRPEGYMQAAAETFEDAYAYIAERFEDKTPQRWRNHAPQAVAI